MSELEALKSTLIATLARLERLESIVGQIYDREDCQLELQAIAAEHYQSGALNRRGLPIQKRIAQIKSILLDEPIQTGTNAPSAKGI